MISVAVNFSNSTLPVVKGNPEINISVSFPRVTFSPVTYAGAQAINFTANNAQMSYNIGDVPDLVKIVGKNLQVVIMDGSPLPPAFRSWDDTDFLLINIDPQGGENISIVAE